MIAIDNSFIEQVSKILGEVISGSQLTKLFSRLNYHDHDSLNPTIKLSTKWKRIENALITECKKTDSSQPLIRLVEEIMNPVNFPPPDSDWPKARADLNYAMEFYGYHLDNSGKVLKQAPVKTYDEAVQRHKTLTEKLTPFEIHPTVLKFCKPELLAKNYFHAIFEASKSVFQRIRDLNQSSLDGMQLVNSSFNLKNPSIIINGYTFENNEEKSEYHGLVSIVSSICYIYRNPKAHTLRLYNPSLENDAVTALMLISLAHKLLDRCIVVRYID